jgi:hypothetical protein
VSGFDLADPDRGTFVSAHEGGAAIVFEHEQVLIAGPAGGALSDGAGEHGSLALGDTSLEVDLSPLGAPLRLDGALIGAAELTLCRASGALRHDSGETPIDGLAVRTRATDPAPGEAVLRRSVAIAFADGGLLALLAARPPGVDGHGAEEVVARLTDPEGEVAISEALLSTQYDEEGHHCRANVELWREGEVPLRAAGTIVCGASVEVGDLRVETAFFRWSLDGRPGLGRYEIVRHA